MKVGMDRKVLLIAFTLLLQAWISHSSEQEGAIIAYASRFIRPSSSFDVFLSSSHDEDVDVEATIRGGEGIFVSSTTTVPAGQRTTLPLRIPSLASTNPYRLLLSATSWKVNGTSELVLLEKESLVLIQLDQPIYKPGDIVNYRVLVLNSNLTLDENVRTIDIRLRNPKGIVADKHPQVKNQYKDYPGYFEGFFGLLNSDPLSGTWTVEAAGSDIGIVQKKLEVADYKLPSFSLEVIPPLFVQGKQDTMKLIVEMRDTVGSPLQGKVVIELNDGIDPPRKLSPLVVHGIKHVEEPLDLVSLHAEYCPLSESTKVGINIIATGVEIFTNKSVTIKKMVPYFCDPFKMSMALSTHHFRPGAETNATVRLSRHDGKKYVLPSGHTWTRNQFSGKQLTDDEESEDLTIRDPIMIDDMTVILPFQSASNAESVKITVDFGDAEISFPFKARSGHAEIEMDTTRLYSPGDAVQFTLRCTQACSRMEYAIVGPKGVMWAESVRMTSESSGTLRIAVTPGMVPEARIVAYYLKGTELFSVIGKFRVKESSLIKDVKVLVPSTASSQTYIKPGNTLRVEVTSEPNSLVGLLAIDKSLLQLRTGNDITVAEVISKYRPIPAVLNDTDGDSSVCAQEDTEDQCFWRKQIAAFTEANLIVHVFSPNGAHNPPLTQNAPPRMDFRQSFLFTTNFTNSIGQCSFLSAVPDSITTWSITAFSASKTKALGLTTIPAEVKVYQDFFITMDLPDTLIEHESGFFNVTVFNLRGQAIEMHVSMELSTVPPSQKLRRLPKNNQRAQVVRFPLGPFIEGNQKVKVTLEDVSTAVLLDQVMKNISVIQSGVVGHWTSDVKRLANETVEILVEHLDIERTVDIVPESGSCQLHIYGYSLEVPVRDLYAAEKSDIVFRSYADSAEQIMARLMGNVFWLKLLEVSHNPAAGQTLSEEETAHTKKKDELVNNLRTVHKRLSHYRLENGSYNTLGRAREPGSTWLTACAVQGLVLAQKCGIAINSNQWEYSLKFLESTQQHDGRFQEGGQIVDKAYQGETGKNPALSAFVTLAFVEAGMNNDVVRKAKSYLEYMIHGHMRISPHALAVVCYALGRLHSEQGRHCIQRLEEAATIVPGKMYWNATEGGKKKPAIDTETTAYALLALHSGNYTGDLSPVINWLTSQRHNAGKLKPTQDKVMILRAFGQVAKDYLNSDKPLHVDVHADTVKIASVTISPHDTEPKYLDLPSTVRKVTMKTSGNGKGRSQVQCKYNKVPSSTKAATTINKILEANAALRKFGNGPLLVLEVCVTYKSSNPSGVVSIEIPALSGLKFQKGDEHEKEELLNPKVKVLPYTENDKVAHIAITEITSSAPVCVEEFLIEVNDISAPSSRTIRVYLEDDQKVEALVEYSPIDMK